MGNSSDQMVRNVTELVPRHLCCCTSSKYVTKEVLSVNIRCGKLVRMNRLGVMGFTIAGHVWKTSC